MKIWLSVICFHTLHRIIIFQMDPMGTARSLSESRKRLYRNQSVPTLLELIKFANRTGKYVMFNLRSPSEGHPYFNQTNDLTFDVIREGGIDPKKVWTFITRFIYAVKYAKSLKKKPTQLINTIWNENWDQILYIQVWH